MALKIEITCQTPGFRRAGRAWPESTVLARGDLTDEQWARVEAEPELTVAPITPQGLDAILGAISPAPPVEAQAGSDRAGPTWARDQMLISGIRRMTAQEDPSFWMRSGAPKITAMRAQMGDDSITTAERDAAWLAILVQG